jgi:hypothetical protein
MVWSRMGMLDDAIREHLELKRLRGADPGEVAREEHDALGPVQREAGGAESEFAAEGAPGRAVSAEAPSGEAAADEAAPASAGWAELDENDAAESGPSIYETAESRSDPNVAHAGQETVEINMEAELGGEKRATPPAPPSDGRNAPVGHPAHTQQPSSEESLEWEMPGDRSEDAAVEGPAGEEASEELVEDVLEETPDFLRETPEQERLWFEQRPPRDFDFNE